MEPREEINVLVVDAEEEEVYVRVDIKEDVMPKEEEEEIELRGRSQRGGEPREHS